MTLTAKLQTTEKTRVVLCNEFQTDYKKRQKKVNYLYATFAAGTN